MEIYEQKTKAFGELLLSVESIKRSVKILEDLWQWGAIRLFTDDIDLIDGYLQQLEEEKEKLIKIRNAYGKIANTKGKPEFQRVVKVEN